MKAPRWARWLLRTMAPTEHEDEVVGDLEEAHRLHLVRMGPIRGRMRTALEALDVALALLKGRVRPPSAQAVQGSGSGPGMPPSAWIRRAAGPSWLDFKLGLRMLGKYPGLTTVAGLAIAFAVALGSGTVEFASDFFYPTMPFEEGERIVQIRNRNLATGRADPRVLHDFELWRRTAESVVDLGAFASYRRNLFTEAGQARPVTGAEMTAAAFAIPRVAPLLGRPLLERDERPGGPTVGVIGHGLWVSQFGGDADILGKTVRLGAEAVTLVGVMPEGFAFPHNHAVWTPLRPDELDHPRGEGPWIEVLGRLAPGVDLAEAQSEFTAIGLRTARDFRATNEQLRPMVNRFGTIPELAQNWLPAGFYFGVLVAFSLLMLLTGSNVALLLFTRTAARESEITVRTALGATRSRIITQLFVEALVLAVLATVVGLWVGQRGLGWTIALMRRLGGGEFLSFWFDAGLSTGTMATALALAALAAGVAGVLPALKSTGPKVQRALQRSGAGRGGPGVGRLWTTVIVTQIALTVAFVPVVIVIGYQTAEVRAADMGFLAEEYLSARLQKPASTDGFELAAGDQETVDVFQEIKRRLSAEPGVSAVAMSSHAPGANHPLRWIEVEDGIVLDGTARRFRVATGYVDADYFEALRAPMVAGRGFRASDLRPGQNVAVVNEDFVRFVMDDRHPIGRRFSYVDPRRPLEAGQERTWFEVIGVVSQVAMQIDPDLDTGAGLYHPLVLERADVTMAIRAGPNPVSFSPRLHEIVLDVDPSVQVSSVRSMDQGAWQTELLYRSWFWVVLAASGMGLMLTLAGIYSVMAFIVSRRTREIGVRVALGAGSGRVLASIFSRALAQLSLGVVLGGGLCVIFVFAVSQGSFRPGLRELAVTAAYLSLMFGVLLLACVGPTRRALAIEPTEALQSER